MIPVLFKEDEQIFSHNGIGALYESLSCDIYEAENGAFTMELEYPVDGEWFSELKDFRIVQAKPNDIDNPHNFRIYEIEKSIDELSVYVRANTRTNDLGSNLITNYDGKDVTPQEAMNGMKNNLIEPTNFDLVSDIQTKSSVEWTRLNPLNAIVGTRGSLVDVWGGEIKRTNNAIHLYSRRGRDNVTTIRPGKNIEGLDMTVSTAGLVTKILPSYSYRPVEVPKYQMVETHDGTRQKRRVPNSGDTILRDDLTVLGDVVTSQYVDNYPVHHWASVDYGDDDELRETIDDYINNRLTEAEESETILDMSNFDKDLEEFVKAELDKKAEGYFTYRNPGVDKPTVRINVDMLQLSDSPEWEQFESLERIGLTDTLDVWVEKYDIDVEVRVTGLNYDSIGERVTGFNAGSDRAPRQTIAEKQYADLKDSTEKYITTVKNGVQNVLRNTADGLNRKFEGYTEPPDELSSEGDIWFKEVGEGKVEIWIHDGVYWQPLLTEDFAEQIQAEVDSATEAANKAVDEVNNAVEAAGFTSLDETISYIDTVSNNAQSNAQQAITDASNAFSAAQTAIDGLDDKVDLSDYNTTLLDLEADIDSALTAGNTAKETAEGLITQVESIGTIADSAKQEAETAVGTANDAKTSADTLATEVSGLKIDINGFELTVNDYEDQVSQFSADVDGFQSTVASYETEVDEFGNIVSTNTTQVSELKNDINGFESLLASYDEDLDGFNTTVSSFRNTLEGLESTVSSYETEVDEYGNEVASYATELSTLRNTVNGFESTVAEFDTTVEGYQSSLATLTNTVDGFESTVATYETQVDEYGNEVSSYATEVATLENTVDGFNSLVASFEKEAEGYSAEVSEFRNTVSGLQSTVASYEVELDEYGNTVDSYATQVSTFNNTVDGLESSVADYEQTVSGYSTQLATLTNTVDGFNSTVTSYETQLDEYGTEVSQYATEVSTLNNTVDGFESTVGNYQTELLGYRNDISQYENQVSTMQNTVDGFNSTVAQYTTEVDEFGNEVDAYATQVSTLENTVDGFNSTVSDFQYDLDNLEIGGRNLLRNSDFSDGLYAIGDDRWQFRGTEGELTSDNNLLIKSETGVSSRMDTVIWTSNREEFPSGSYLTLTFKLKTNSPNVILVRLGSSGWSSGTHRLSVGTEMKEYSVSFPISNSTNDTRAVVFWLESAGEIEIERAQLEKGNIATDWTPAPEDMATESQVSTLTNTVDGFQSKVDKVEQDYQGISGTVATHTSEISNLDGEIALKANTSTVNNLTGRVSTAESGITSNANAIKLKASQSSVDTLSGTVNDIGAQVDVTAGQISNKVWNTDIQTAVDDIEVGGRNLFSVNQYVSLRNSEGTTNGNRYSVGSSGALVVNGVDGSNGYDSMKMVDLKANTEYIFTFNIPINDRFTLYDTDGVRVSVAKKWNSNNTQLTFKMGNVDGYIGGKFYPIEQSYPVEIYLMAEKGNKATDWTPAPEDTDAKIDYIETEWTQTFDTFSQTVSGIDGRVTAQKQTIDSISSTVSGHGNRISAVEQTASGLQTTVADKASQSQVTQLATGLSSVVTDLNNVEIGGRNLIRNSNSFNFTPRGDMGLRVDNDADLVVEEWGATNATKIRLVNGLNSTSLLKATLHDYSYDPYIVGEIYTFSFFIRNDRDIDVPIIIELNGFTDYEPVRIEGGESKKVVITAKKTDNNFPQVRFNAQRIVNNLEFTIWGYKVEKGNKATDWTPAPEDVQSQISQLADNINLRVSKGDVLSQINVEAGRTLIQSKKLVLNATNTTISGTTWMSGAVIQNGTIASAKIGSLDVSKLSGNITNFMRSNWNSATGGNVRITGSGIVSTASDSSQVYVQNGVVGARNPQGASLGHFGYNWTTDRAFLNLETSLGTNFSISARKGTSGNTTRYTMMDIFPGSSETYIRTDDFRHVGASDSSAQPFARFGGDVRIDGEIAAGRSTLNIQQIDFRYGSWIYDDHRNSGLRVVGGTDIRFYTGGASSGGSSHAFRVDNSHVYMHRTLSMEGNGITNQSDERLKYDILEHQQSSLDKIRRFDFVDFKWIKDGREDFGLIAQQVKKVAPELVLESPDGYLSLNNSLLNMKTSHAVQELSFEVKSNEDKVHTLQQELSKANREIKELKEQMA